MCFTNNLLKWTRFIIILPLCIIYHAGHTQYRTAIITETSHPLVIDGADAEEEWSRVKKESSFINHWPADTGLAVLQTETRMMYDKRNLYLFAKVFNSNKKLVVQSLKRDLNPYYSDGISIVIDPSGSAVSGYTFGVNSAGAQFDGIVNNNDVSFDWDAKWYSAIKRYDTYWTAEMAIPLKSIRFSPEKNSWRINFVRNDMTNNCFSTWNRVPIQFHGANLGYMGEFSFSGNMKNRSTKLPVFIPYINTRIQRVDGLSSHSFKTGIDLKVPLASSLNLDVTIKPDFSQVDVDQQVINLNRYDILLPEKRIFFLENGDLFNSLGTSNIQPFVSRSIGLDKNGKTVPLAGGLRLTGFVTPKLRVGIMDIQSGKIDSNTLQNYFVTAVEHRIFKRSDIKAYFINSQSIYSGFDKKNRMAEYNRIAGTEFNYLKSDGSLSSGIKLAASFNPGQQTENSFYNINFAVRNARRLLSLKLNSVGKNFITSLGYTPRLYNYDALNDTTRRLGYYQADGFAEFDFYPASQKKINMTLITFAPAIYWFRDGKFSEANLDLAYTILTADRKSFKIGYVHNFSNLPFETSIFSSLNNLEARSYSSGVAVLRYESNFLKPFSWTADIQGGGYYNGKRLSIYGEVKKRIQPWLNLGTGITWNYIELNKRSIVPVIINPSVEVAFNNKLFLTTFMQYNSLVHNFNLNTRFNWRFSPMSDIYLVFNSNYITPSYHNSGSTLTLKLSYWIN